MASLPLHVGASVQQDTDLGVLMVRQRGSGSAMNYAAMPRWQALDMACQPRPADRDDASRGQLAVACCWPTGSTAHRAWSRSWRRSAGDGCWARPRCGSGHASVVPHLDPRLRFEAVQPRSVADHEALERAVFGVDPSRAEARRQELSEALASGSLRALVVRLEDEPIAVARVSQGQGVAGIYAVGVARAWRGKGYGTLLVTIATRAGMATGNRIVWLSVEDGNDPARHVYDKLGFQPAFGWARWLAPAD